MKHKALKMIMIHLRSVTHRLFLFSDVSCLIILTSTLNTPFLVVTNSRQKKTSGSLAAKCWTSSASCKLFPSSAAWQGANRGLESLLPKQLPVTSGNGGDGSCKTKPETINSKDAANESETMVRNRAKGKFPETFHFGRGLFSKDT